LGYFEAIFLHRQRRFSKKLTSNNKMWCWDELVHICLHP